MHDIISFTYRVSLYAPYISLPLFFLFKNGVTPLHEACFYGQTETATALLDSGADIEARNKVSQLLQLKLTICSTIAFDLSFCLFILAIIHVDGFAVDIGL